MFCFEKNKQKALDLLKQKNGKIKITFSKASQQTEYRKSQLIRSSQKARKKDVEFLLVHGLTDRNFNN